MPQRRAKIAGTLGPASDTRQVLDRMITAGMDVARLNFSHGDVPDHERRVKQVRLSARKAGRGLALMADLQGPRFRVGKLPEGALTLVEGETVRIEAGQQAASGGVLPVVYAALAKDVRRNHRILIDDGKIELRVVSVRGGSVRAEVMRGGEVTDNKGINLPGTQLSVPALMDKDKADLKTAVRLKADWLAVSFVRCAQDIRLARRLLKRQGSDMLIMAKIERPEAVDNLEEILEASDGLLVARGDLGVELEPERVPILQKQIIELANDAGKPVMTATQMLDSMRHHSRPTRAEASDVANAVLDGSSCLLLTAETAAGKYPVESIRMMNKIICEAEKSGRTQRPALPQGELRISVATTLAACRAAYDVGAAYLVVFTQTGFSARQACRFRPSIPILAYTPDAGTAQRLNMNWGVESGVAARRRTVDQMLTALDKTLLDQKRVRKGDKVVVLMGTPIGLGGTTNLMEVRRVGVSPTRHLVVRGEKSGGTRKSVRR